MNYTLEDLREISRSVANKAFGLGIIMGGAVTAMIAYLLTS